MRGLLRAAEVLGHAWAGTAGRACDWACGRTARLAVCRLPRQQHRGAAASAGSGDGCQYLPPRAEWASWGSGAACWACVLPGLQQALCFDGALHGCFKLLGARGLHAPAACPWSLGVQGRPCAAWAPRAGSCRAHDEHTASGAPACCRVCAAAPAGGVRVLGSSAGLCCGADGWLGVRTARGTGTLASGGVVCCWLGWGGAAPPSLLFAPLVGGVATRFLQAAALPRTALHGSARGQAPAGGLPLTCGLRWGCPCPCLLEWAASGLGAGRPCGPAGEPAGPGAELPGFCQLGCLSNSQLLCLLTSICRPSCFPLDMSRR